jgi:hypothetical protein
MKSKILLVIAPLLSLAAFVLPNRADAQFILDTGTPAGISSPILSTSQWFAGEFAATQGETITQLSAHLTAGGVGNTFTFDIFSDDSGAFLNTRNAQLSSLLEIGATGTYTASGWNSSTINWAFPATGDYWFAIEENSTVTHNKPTFDMPTESSTNTGTVPALAFAIDSGVQFSTTNAVPVGLEITIAPEPANYGLIGMAALVALSVWTAKRRKISAAS